MQMTGHMLGLGGDCNVIDDDALGRWSVSGAPRGYPNETEGPPSRAMPVSLDLSELSGHAGR